MEKRQRNFCEGGCDKLCGPTDANVQKITIEGPCEVHIKIIPQTTTCRTSCDASPNVCGSEDVESCDISPLQHSCTDNFTGVQNIPSENPQNLFGPATVERPPISALGCPCEDKCKDIRICSPKTFGGSKPICCGSDGQDILSQAASRTNTCLGNYRKEKASINSPHSRSDHPQEKCGIGENTCDMKENSQELTGRPCAHVHQPRGLPVPYSKYMGLKAFRRAYIDQIKKKALKKAKRLYARLPEEEKRTWRPQNRRTAGQAGNVVSNEASAPNSSAEVTNRNLASGSNIVAGTENTTP